MNLLLSLGVTRSGFGCSAPEAKAGLGERGLLDEHPVVAYG